jgi:hypothetical protein
LKNPNKELHLEGTWNSSVLELSTEAAVVGKAAKGEIVTLVEQTSGEWWKVSTKDGEEGYAYSRYLKA